MDKVVIKAGEWIVVCDGRKALILENMGDATFPNLRRRQVLEHADAPTSALGTDRPGRVQQSVGGGHSAVGQTDWHDQAERTFLEQLAAKLDAAIRHGEIQALGIVAPPRALGMLRHAVTPAVRAAIRFELNKDFTRMPIDEIERELTGV